jgi:hypothetical protein
MNQKLEPGKYPVARNVWIKQLPAIKVEGKKQTLKVILRDHPAKPPKLPAKKINGVIVNPCLLQYLIEPQVINEQTGKEVYRFDQPLTIVVELTEEDVAKARRCRAQQGYKLAPGENPPISFYSWWHDGERLRWQKTAPKNLKWDPSGKGGALTVELWTLRPKDGGADGCP